MALSLAWDMNLYIIPKEMLNYFDTKSSAFLEDESRDSAKPNPQSLINAIQSNEI